MKRLRFIAIIIFSTFIFSGCSSSVPSNQKSSPGFFMKSTDGGANWEAKSKIGGGNKVILDNILSMAISPSDPSVIYVGTEKDGFFVSRDGSESWQKVNVPVKKKYILLYLLLMGLYMFVGFLIRKEKFIRLLIRKKNGKRFIPNHLQNL